LKYFSSETKFARIAPSCESEMMEPTPPQYESDGKLGGWNHALRLAYHEQTSSLHFETVRLRRLRLDDVQIASLPIR